MKYFILSLDGGGIRGALSAALIREIEAKTGFLGNVNLFAGTSTGGILALGLAKGLEPSKLQDLYVKRGKDIFGPRDLFDTIAGPADEVYRANYSTVKLKKVLRKVFGADTLASLKKKVLIASFHLGSRSTGRWKPKFFDNFENNGNDGAVSIVDVALRTSAAPTYFPSCKGHIDGGVVANNPAVCAIAKAVKAGVPLADIRLLSIGTGFNPHRIGGERHDWGVMQWGTRILELVLEGSQEVPDYQCQQLLGAAYQRLQVKLPRPMKLDAVDQVQELLALMDTSEVQSQVQGAVSFVCSS